MITHGCKINFQKSRKSERVGCHLAEMAGNGP